MATSNLVSVNRNGERLQWGNGDSNHVAVINTVYTNVDSDIQWVNADGASTWALKLEDAYLAVQLDSKETKFSGISDIPLSLKQT